MASYQDEQDLATPRIGPLRKQPPFPPLITVAIRTVRTLAAYAVLLTAAMSFLPDGCDRTLVRVFLALAVGLTFILRAIPAAAVGGGASPRLESGRNNVRTDLEETMPLEDEKSS